MSARSRSVATEGGEIELLSVDVIRPRTGATVTVEGVAFAGETLLPNGLHVVDDAQSTSAATGSIRCASGGATVAKSLRTGGDLKADQVSVGGNLAVTGDLSATGGASSSAAVASTTPATGAILVGASGLTTSGGAAVGGALKCTALTVAGGVEVVGTLTTSGSVVASGEVAYRHLTVTNACTATATTPSTSPTTGAVRIGPDGCTTGTLSATKITLTGDVTVTASDAISSFSDNLTVQGSLSTAGGIKTAPTGGLSTTVAVTVAAGEPTRFGGVVACDDAAADSLAVSGGLSVGGGGQLTVGGSAHLAAGSAIACEDGAPVFFDAAASTPDGVWDARGLAPGESATAYAPVATGCRPSCALAVVASLYVRQSDSAAPAVDVPIVTRTAWAVAGAVVPTVFSKETASTAHIVPGVVTRVVLSTETAPASSVDSNTLLVEIECGASSAVTAFVSGVWLRYVKQSIGTDVVA